jgi:YVTN family beta-propeller protein
VIDTIRGLAEPTGVAVTPDGRKVYVADSAVATVSVIATANEKVIATIPVGSRPVAIGLFIQPFSATLKGP